MCETYIESELLYRAVDVQSKTKCGITSRTGVHADGFGRHREVDVPCLCCLPGVTLQEPFARRRGRFWNMCRRKVTNNEESDRYKKSQYLAPMLLCSHAHPSVSSRTHSLL